MRAVPRAGIRAFQEGKVEFCERRKAGKRTNIKPKTRSPSRYKNENLLISIWIFTLLIWFLQAPAMRFGFSYLVIIFFLLNFYFLKFLNFSYQKIISSRYLDKIFNLLFILMICYQLYRINF